MASKPPGALSMESIFSRRINSIFRTFKNSLMFSLSS